MQQVQTVSENVHVQRATAQMVAAASSAKDSVEGAVKHMSKTHYTGSTQHRLAGMAAHLQQMTGYNSNSPVPSRNQQLMVRFVDSNRLGQNFLSSPIALHLIVSQRTVAALDLSRKDQAVARRSQFIDPTILIRLELHQEYFANSLESQRGRGSSVSVSVDALTGVLGGLVSQAGSVLGTFGKEVSHLGKEIGRDLVSDFQSVLKTDADFGNSATSVDGGGSGGGRRPLRSGSRSGSGSDSDRGGSLSQSLVSVTFPGSGRLGLSLCPSPNRSTTGRLQYLVCIKDIPRISVAPQGPAPAGAATTTAAGTTTKPGLVEKYNAQAPESKKLRVGMLLVAVNGKN